MEQEFTEFSELRESDKSLEHESGSCLLHVSCWHCDSILVSFARGGLAVGSSPFTTMTNISKALSESSTESNQWQLEIRLNCVRLVRV